MIENEIKNENEIGEVYGPNKMIKIFENQRITLNKDIIFLKEDILKDFKRIENNLNSKYEKQNVNTTNKLYKFESTIEAMKNKIDDLSSIISTDKNIQQKVLQLNEFKRSITDKMMNQELSIKVNSSELKDAINKYDKILTESVIYPSIIGSSARFKDFHEMIDYILSGVTDFNSFKEKNSVDFKEYAIKIDLLYNSLKAQTDSIISTCNNFCTKQISIFDTKIGKMINTQELNIYDIKRENDEMNRNLHEKMKEFNDIIRNINKTKDEIYKKFEKEMNKIKEFKDETEKNLDKYRNDFNLMNKRLNQIYGKTNNDNGRNREVLLNKESNSNIGINLKKSQLGTSLVKKYIDGEISFNEIEDPQVKKKILKESKEKLTKKRMTLGPDNLEEVLNNNILNKNSDLGNVNSDQDMNKKSQKIENNITDSSFDKSEDEKYKIIRESKNINTTKNLLKIPNLLNEKEYKNDELYSTKQKAYQLLMFQSPKENSLFKNNTRYIEYNENKNNIIVDNNNIIDDKNSAFTKLKSIGINNNMINHDNKKVNRRKKNANVELYDKINNNKKYNYYSVFENYNDIKIKNTNNKLNIIEINFDKRLQAVNKEKDDLQFLIKKIKEKKQNTAGRKNRIIKLSKYKANSTNNLDLFYKNKMVKEEINNYKSYEDINNIQPNKNSFNHQRLYSSKYY